MKRKYKNIKIPYCYVYKYDSLYIYNDKYYENIIDAFSNYIGFKLKYHFIIDNKLIEVHDINKIAEYILSGNIFKIPDEYIDEYTEEEYKRINSFYKNHTELKEHNREKVKFKDILKDPFFYYYSYKLHKLYKNYNYPKKVYCKFLKREIFAYKGEERSIKDLFDNFYFYYQFSIENNNSHEHFFENVLKRLYNDLNLFKIQENQTIYYSKQELIFLNKLIKKLKEDNFDISIYKEKNAYFNFKWYELKKNHRYFKLLIFNIKEFFYKIKYKKQILNMCKKINNITHARA